MMKLAAANAALFAVVLVSGASQNARAETVDGSTIGALGSSSAEDDGALMSISRIAVTTRAGFSVFGVGVVGYAAQGRRVLTAGGIGAMISGSYDRFSPRLGAALVLQNERSLESVLDDPLGTAIGTGDDVTRRPGVMGTAGVDFRLWNAHGLELFATAEVSVTRLVAGARSVAPLQQDSGASSLMSRPTHYIAAGAGLGARIEFSLGNP